MFKTSVDCISRITRDGISSMSGHPEVAINIAENHTFVIKNLVTCILGLFDWQLKSFKDVTCRMI